MTTATAQGAQERTGVVTFKGNPLTLLGPDIKVGDSAPDFQVLDPALGTMKFSDAKGKVRIISVVPSLDTPVGEEGETEMIDLLQDETMPSTQETITRFLQHERIEALLKHMNERERRVLTLRYGLDDGVARTLGETAKEFGITRERVRQIEVAAIRKLRTYIATESPEALQDTQTKPHEKESGRITSRA